jgi:pyruvate/2-oxoacid:ferredoxin oxidoreductase beta subunit
VILEPISSLADAHILRSSMSLVTRTCAGCGPALSYRLIAKAAGKNIYL